MFRFITHSSIIYVIKGKDRLIIIHILWNPNYWWIMSLFENNPAEVPFIKGHIQKIQTTSKCKSKSTIPHKVVPCSHKSQTNWWNSVSKDHIPSNDRRLCWVLLLLVVSVRCKDTVEVLWSYSPPALSVSSLNCMEGEVSYH